MLTTFFKFLQRDYLLNVKDIEDFQMKAKSERYAELNDCPWYVDDSVWRSNKDKADDILNHLKRIDPENIKSTMEKEADNNLSSMDLEMNVNRKTKKVKFSVHYKKTNTNTTIKKRSNNRDMRSNKGLRR